jgi:hypothetical protein
VGPTQLPVKWVLGAVSVGLKLQGCEADHSQLVLSSRKIELYLHPPYFFMAW